MNDACPHCGQKVLVRLGVMLSPRLTEIFDVIERSWNRRTTREVFGWMFYGNKSKRDGQRCVAVSINHINGKLCSTDYQDPHDGTVWAVPTMQKRNGSVWGNTEPSGNA